MIIIKRILCFLIAAILSFNLVSVFAAEENLSYSVISLEDSAYIYQQGSWDGRGMYNVQAWRLKGDIAGGAKGTDYNLTAFVKFDISSIDADSLKKAEMLVKRRTVGNSPFHLTLRDIPDTSWVGSEINFTGNEVTDFERYVDPSKSVLATFPGTINTEIISLGYENCDGASDAADITDYILEKKQEGNQYVSMCIALDSSPYAAFSIEKTAFLRITYTDNRLPSINAEIAENIPESADYTFGMEIIDEDNDNLTSVEVKFDDKVILSESDIGAPSFTQAVTVPAGDITVGEHTVTITAADENDRVRVFKAKITAAKVKTEILSKDEGSCTLKVTNIANSDLEVIICAIAAGEGDEVNDADFAGKKLAPGEEAEFTLNVDVQNGETFKLFAWSGDKIFTPLSEIF